MDSLIQADIFFFVTTIAIVLIGSLVLIAAMYVVRILNDVRYISKRVRQEADLLVDDFEAIRSRLKDDGLFSGLAGIMSLIMNGRKSKKRKPKVEK